METLESSVVETLNCSEESSMESTLKVILHITSQAMVEKNWNNELTVILIPIILLLSK